MIASRRLYFGLDGAADNAAKGFGRLAGDISSFLGGLDCHVLNNRVCESVSVNARLNVNVSVSVKA